MDLVRLILKELSESEGPLDASAFVTDSADHDKVAYHFEIMEQAGLIEASVSRSWGGGCVKARAERLTWAGNDFLDAVASDRLWGKVKATIAKTVTAASFETVKALAVKLAADALL